MTDRQDRRTGALMRALGRKLESKDISLDVIGPDSYEEGEGIDDPSFLERSVTTVLDLAERVGKEREEAPTRLAELLAMPAAERETTVLVECQYQTYTLASYILERCAKAVFHDPALARELARLSKAIASQTDPRSCGGTASLADLEAYAVAMEGNALRVAGELREALTSFFEARSILERGGADPDLAARIDLLEASLRRDLRQFPAALSLLDRAEANFAALRDNNQVARLEIVRALIFQEQRDLDRAVASLRKAVPLAVDPWLALHIHHNLISALVVCGSAREAADLYVQCRHLYLQFSDPLTTSRRIWVEGVIARELGEDLELASRLLTEAVDRLTEHGYSYDAALAGLDLVAVYAKQKQATEVLRVATDLVKLFQVRNVDPEALAALKIVHEAAERDAVNLALLAEAASHLRANRLAADPA